MQQIKLYAIMRYVAREAKPQAFKSFQNLKRILMRDGDKGYFYIIFGYNATTPLSNVSA